MAQIGVAPLYFRPRYGIRTKQKGSLRCTQILSDTVRREALSLERRKKASFPCPKYESVCILIIAFFSSRFHPPKATFLRVMARPVFEPVWSWLPSTGSLEAISALPGTGPLSSVNRIAVGLFPLPVSFESLCFARHIVPPLDRLPAAGITASGKRRRALGRTRSRPRFPAVSGLLEAVAARFAADRRPGPKAPRVRAAVRRDTESVPLRRLAPHTPVPSSRPALRPYSRRPRPSVRLGLFAVRTGRLKGWGLFRFAPAKERPPISDSRTAIRPPLPADRSFRPPVTRIRSASPQGEYAARYRYTGVVRAETVLFEEGSDVARSAGYATPFEDSGSGPPADGVIGGTLRITKALLRRYARPHRRGRTFPIRRGVRRHRASAAPLSALYCLAKYLLRCICRAVGVGEAPIRRPSACGSGNRRLPRTGSGPAPAACWPPA